MSFHGSDCPQFGVMMIALKEKSKNIVKRIKEKCAWLCTLFVEQYNKSSVFSFFVIFFGCLLAYIIKYALMKGYFLTNDDTGLMKRLSGYFTGKPESYSPYVTTPMGTIFTKLYNWFPDISWYSYFHIFSTVLCISIAFFVISKKIPIQPRRRWILTHIFAFIYFVAVFIYPFHYLSWTVSAALYCMAATMMLLTVNRGDSNKKLFLKLFIIFVLLTMSPLIRSSSYIGAVPFFLLTFLYIYITRIHSKERSRRVKVTVIAVTMILVSLISCINKFDKYYKNHYLESESYIQLEKYRARFSDYDVLPYEGNEAFYESIGWDEELFNVSRSWMYIDRRFNADTLKQIVEASKNEGGTSFSLSSKIQKAWYNFFKPTEHYIFAVAKRTTTVCLMLLAVCGTVMCFLRWRKRRKDLPVFLYFAGVNCLVSAELIYLCFLGRFILRSFFCPALPALCLDLWLLIGWLDKILAWLKSFDLLPDKSIPSKTGFAKKRIRVSTSVISACMIVCIFSMLYMCRYTLSFKNGYLLQKNAARVSSVEKYCLAHPDNYYVYSMGTLSRDVELIPDNIKEMRGCRKNMLFWGGSSVFSKSYYDQIKSFGYDEFYSDKLLDDNVFFITPDFNPEETDFTYYMRKAYGEDIICQKVESITYDIFVYKFLRAGDTAEVQTEDN